MKNLIIGLLLVIALLVGVHMAPMIPGAALAQRQQQQIQVTVPRAWGKVAGVVGGMNILFEAGDGTIRFVDAQKGTVQWTVTRN